MRAGHEVSCQQSGLDGLAHLKSDPDRIDLAIIDLRLNDIPGLELLARLRGVRSDLPCILSSGHAPGIDDLPEGLRARTFLLPKPYRSRELTEMVENIQTDFNCLSDKQFSS